MRLHMAAKFPSAVTFTAVLSLVLLGRCTVILESLDLKYWLTCKRVHWDGRTTRPAHTAGAAASMDVLP
jgi:hypothetical protein